MPSLVLQVADTPPVSWLGVLVESSGWAAASLLGDTTRKSFCCIGGGIAWVERLRTHCKEAIIFEGSKEGCGPACGLGKRGGDLWGREWGRTARC